MATPSPAPVNPRTAPPGGIDPDVKKPKGVSAAAAKADELFKAAQQANGVSADEAPPAANGGDTITISDAPPPPAAAPPVQPQAQPPVQQQPQQATPPATPPADEGTVSRNEFNAMKGRFDQAQKNNIRLSEEITNLRTLVTQLSSAPPAATPTPPELQAQSLVTPQEVADYGEDFLDVVGRKAREIAGAEVASLKKQIDELTNGVRATAQVSAQTARENLMKELAREVPGWETQNTQPEFLAWLGLPDVFSGAIRGELLKQAFDQNNAARVIAFFKGFLTEEAATTPAATTPPAVDPTKTPLEQFAAPGRAKSAAAPAAPAEKPIITRAQVTQFYLDVAAGKYQGRAEEKNRLEAMIFSATNEGRLR